MFVIVCSLSQNGFAQQTTLLQTKDKLKQLNDKITRLKQTLSHSEDKRGILNHELGDAEKQIGTCIQKINTTQQTIALKQQNIASLQQRLKVLNNELTTQQNLLAQHVRARYKMGEYRPLIIALNQPDWYKINRLVTFYQYLVQKRQDVIDSIIQMQKDIAHDQASLEQEIKAQQHLQEQMRALRENLEQSKNYHQIVIKSLNQEIQSQQHTLSEFEQDRANLARLLQALVRESQVVVRPAQPFPGMRHKLPYPVAVSRNAIQRMNQGDTFLAAEGTAVKAVYPGRVVFSDWLKGYGLLLIIDHGQGFMTLYAHNQALFQAKGAQVAAGEKIATIGHSGGLRQNGLYFEVRQRGKAVSPLEWLS